MNETPQTRTILTGDTEDSIGAVKETHQTKNVRQNSKSDRARSKRKEMTKKVRGSGVELRAGGDVSLRSRGGVPVGPKNPEK